MAYNYVTVTYTYETSLLAAAIGRVEWRPSGPITDSTNHLEFEEPVQLVELDANGAFSVSLLATDNAGLSSFNWVFTPWVQGEEVEATAYLVAHADGASQTLDSLTKA